MVQNSEHFSPVRNGSVRNSESFLFRGTAGILPEQTNCSIYFVFHEIIFLSEIANPGGAGGLGLDSHCNTFSVCFSNEMLTHDLWLIIHAAGRSQA
jgi:hypothetical protein